MNHSKRNSSSPGVKSNQPLAAVKSGRYGAAGRESYVSEHGSFIDRPAPGNTVGDLVAKILRRKWWVLLVLVACLSIAAVRSFKRPTYYLATATIMLSEDNQGDLYGPSKIADPTAKFYRSYVFFRMNTIAEVMSTAPVRQAVSEYMQQSASGSNSDDLGPQQSPSLSPAIGSVYVPPLSVAQGKGTSLISLNTTDRRPEIAQRSLEGYMGVLAQYYRERKHGDALKAAAWLKEELDKARADLRTSRAVIQAFKMQHGVITDDEREGLIRHLATSWLDDVTGDEEPKTGRATTLDKRNPQNDNPADEAASSPYLDSLRKRLVDLQARHAELTNVYSAEYPKVVALARKISLVENMIADVVQRNEPPPASQSGRDMVQDVLEQARQAAAKLNVLGPQYRLLAMEVENNQRFYDILLDEYKKAEKRAEAVYVDFVVTNPPTTLEVKPKYMKQLGLGAAAGLLGGIALALILGGLDTRIRSSDDVEYAIPCRTLGTVPDLAWKNKRNPFRATQPGSPIEFLAYDEPNSPIYEAVRNVHSSIFLSTFGRHIRCMSVSSSLPGEGKTLIGVSLATVLSLDKSKNVLIVDGDLRRPRIHKVFGRQQNGPGLTTLVKERKRDWSGVIHPTKVERLFFLPSGPIPADPVSVLQSDGMRDLMASLRHAFDYVIIDSPPVLGFPDAALVGYMADGVVLVVEQAVVRREEVREAFRALSVDAGTSVLGVILNKARPQPRWYGGYYRGYSYGYGKYYSSS